MDHRNPELEQHIIENPRDVESYLVLGDWLQTQSDPRGELIALHYSARFGDAVARARAKELIDEQPEYFLGTLPGWLSSGAVELQWGIGFVESVRIWPSTITLATNFPKLFDRLLDPLLTHPSFRFLQRLLIMPRVTERIDGSLLADQLVDVPPTLRVLWARTTLHTDALCELVTSEGFPLLSGLDLHHGDMTDTGAKFLLDCHELVEQLVYLGIGGNQVSPDSLNLLKLLCPGMVDS